MKRQFGFVALLLLCGNTLTNVAHAEWHRCTPLIGSITENVGQWFDLPCGPDSDTYGIQLKARVNFLGAAEVMANANTMGLQYQVAGFPNCVDDSDSCFTPHNGNVVTEGISTISFPEGVRAIAAEYWVP